MLVDGPHVFRWPGADGAMTDAGAIAAKLVELGAVGVIPQYGLDATAWCVKHASVFAAAGLQVTVGLGMDGNHSLEQYVGAIVGAIDRVGRVCLDWEDPAVWEHPAGHQLARDIVDGVFARRPDADACIVDCGWWAPISLPDRHPTHPSAPTQKFGRLCGSTRYPQCYGAARTKDHETPRGVQGRSYHYLQWARDKSQYASMGMWEIRPTYQCYSRTKQDHVDALLADRTQLLWCLDEMDSECEAAMIDVKRLRALKYDGVMAVREFQAHAGLKTDGICGDLTSAALAGLMPKETR